MYRIKTVQYAKSSDLNINRIFLAENASNQNRVAFIVSNDIIHYRLKCLERVKSFKSATHRTHNKIRVKCLYTTLSKNTIQRSAYDSTQKNIGIKRLFKN